LSGSAATPCDRPPARVAANLLHTRQTLWRDGRREQSLCPATEPLTESVVNTPAAGDRSATGEMVDLVGEAARHGRLRPSGARLILLIRFLDVPIELLAEETGTETLTLRKRRVRPHPVLADAAA